MQLLPHLSSKKGILKYMFSELLHQHELVAKQSLAHKGTRHFWDAPVIHLKDGMQRGMGWGTASLHNQEFVYLPAPVCSASIAAFTLML